MANLTTQQEPIGPGPCGPGGCPPPTEIECIEVLKVYDLCFQPETVMSRDFVFGTANTCVPTAADFCPGNVVICAPEVTQPSPVCEIGTLIPCSLAGAECTELSRTPSGTEGFASITLLISVFVNLFAVGSDPATATPLTTETVTFSKRVTLCAPEGTDVVCNVTGDCNCMITDLIVNTLGSVTSITISCTLDLCVVVKTVADVNLLVPAFGFCVPAECTTFGLLCPPGPPGQCISEQEFTGKPGQTFRISTGFGTVVTAVSLTPEDLAEVTINNLPSSGGVLVTGNFFGQGTLTITYVDGRGNQFVLRATLIIC